MLVVGGQGGEEGQLGGSLAGGQREQARLVGRSSAG